MVPADSAIALPGRTRSSAARAMAAFAAPEISSLARNPGSCAACRASTAPPCTLRTSPRAGELRDVATDRHVGDVELGHELGDPDGAAVLHAAEDEVLALRR